LTRYIDFLMNLSGSTSMIGKTLLHYEIVEKIGAGGMGEVYRARDTRLDRIVALKILPEHFASSAELKQRFAREAMVISSLSHPNICTLHDVGHDDGIDFLVMEYLEGETLGERLRRGRLPAEEVLRFGSEIASALDRAHRSGIVHRDLKPANIMLTKDGVKLLDFGLAKVQSRAVAAATALPTEAATEEPLTERGTVLGTFRYMAPEQLEGEEADARTDIFALGAVLYEMATGHKAFQGKSQASLIAAILERDPEPVSVVEPMTPPMLDWTVRRCLAKHRDERWQSAGDIAAEMRWIAEEGSRAGIPKSVARRRKHFGHLSWVLVALFATAAATIGFLYVHDVSREVRVLRADILPPPGTEFDLNPATPGPVSVSPDGRRLVFTAESSDGEPLLYVRELDAPAARPLAGTEGALYPFWSPDSRDIGYFTEDKLRRIAADGGIPSTLCDAENGKGGTWSRDGVILFAPSADSPIYRVPAVGGESIPVTELDPAGSENSHRFPVFLSDGRRFLYLARTAYFNELSTLMVGRLDGEGSDALTEVESNVAVASDHLLYAREGTLMARPFDENTCSFIGAAFPIAEIVKYLPGACLAVFSVSQNGVLAYVAGASQELTELVIVNYDGEPVRTIGEPAEHRWSAPMISPDERFVAVSIRDPRIGSHDVWIYDVGRDLRTRLTYDPADEMRPTWSPDSESLVFSSKRETHYDLFRIHVSRPGSEELVLTTPADKFAACWSSDGRYLVYESEGAIWALPMVGKGDPFQLLSRGDGTGRPCLSSDGKWLAYDVADGASSDVFITDFPQADRRWQVSVDGGFWPMWSHDRFFYVSRAGIVQSVNYRTEGQALALDPPESLHDVSHTCGGTVFPDGERALQFVPARDPETERLSLVVNWTADSRVP
jgi:serine/threonine protein kinase/Tol biopolymer transport system component